MSLGNPEDSISHETPLGYCPLCRQRGVNNRTELMRFGDFVCCGSCKHFLKGELTRDIPELNLFLKDKTTKKPPAHKIHEEYPRTVSRETPVISPPEDEDTNSSEIAHWLSRTADNKLRRDLMHCMLHDRQLIYAILTNPRYFSLKELKQHAERLNKPEKSPLPDESFERIAIRRKKMHPRSQAKNKVKGKTKCRSPKNQGTRKSRTTRNSNMGKVPLSKEGPISRGLRTLKEKAKDRATQKPEKAPSKDLNLDINQERENGQNSGS